MAINKNHEFEELDGVKCGIVEKNVSASRVNFLKELLAYNGYAVVVVPSPAPKVIPPKPVPVVKPETLSASNPGESAPSATVPTGDVSAPAAADRSLSETSPSTTHTRSPDDKNMVNESFPVQAFTPSLAVTPMLPTGEVARPTQIPSTSAAISISVDVITPAPEPAFTPPPLPETFTVGVTDYTFNPINAIFGRLLHTRDRRIVTLAYWNQEETVSQDEIPYYQKTL